MNNPSPCLRIRTSLTSAGKRNSWGSRTAWLAPLRNMDPRLETAPDVDLAAAFDVTNLLFPVRARFITYPSDGNSRLAYALHGEINMHSLVERGRRDGSLCGQHDSDISAELFCQTNSGYTL
jgi:hypothetical protein